jgi:acyl transferase domain-containing protein
MADENSVAIIGMAGRFPGALDVDAYWKHLDQGDECISVFDTEELDPDSRRLAGQPQFVMAGGVVPDIDLFDAELFRMSAQEAALTDPQHRMFLECAWTALEDAGYGEPSALPGVVGVYAGSMLSSYASRAAGHVRTAHDELQALVASGVDYLPALTSYKLDLRGESLAIQAACATSIVAVHLGCQSLLTGQTDLILAGAVSVDARQRLGYFHERGSTLSPDGHCRPFSADAQGTVRGFGLGVVVLRRLEDAIHAGDPIRAVIRGSAVNNDGRGRIGFTAPSVGGQAHAIANALAMAGVESESIGYVESHGTATPLGDAMEVEALTRAFNSEARGFCALGSVKANIGHLGETSGMASLIKAVLALERRRRPGLANFTTPNPSISFESTPFEISRTSQDWPSANPRRAGVNVYAVGGTNAHLILEEAPPVPPAAVAQGPWLFVFSARTAAGLAREEQQFSEWLDAHPGTPLADIGYTLAFGRRAFDHRHAVIADDYEALRRGLRHPNLERLIVESSATVPATVAHAADVWLEGQPLSDATLFGTRRRVRLPTRAFERQRFWIEPQASSGIHPVAWWLELKR